MNQGEPSRRGFLRKTGIAAAGLAVESKAQAGQRSNATGESSFDVREVGAKADGNSLDTPAINKAIETAALMLGTDKSRGYCLEMICADFLAGASLDNGNSKVLLQSILRFFKFLPGDERLAFIRHATQNAS